MINSNAKELIRDLWPSRNSKQGVVSAFCPILICKARRLLLTSDIHKKIAQMKKISEVIHPDGLAAKLHLLQNSANSGGSFCKRSNIKKGINGTPAALNEQTAVILQKDFYLQELLFYLCYYKSNMFRQHYI